MAEKRFLLSPSGEISVKKPATRNFLLKKLEESLKTRLKSLGYCFAFEAFSSPRFLVSGETKLKECLLTHGGVGKIGEFYPFDENLDVKSLLPKRPFTFEIYVTKAEEKNLFEKALEIKKAWLKLLTKEAKARLKYWDNHPPVHLRLELEAKKEGSFLLVNPQKGLGGFPPGAFSEKVLVLFSGGPDSLLAACLMLRRGLNVSLIYFDDGEKERAAKVREIASGLSYLFPDTKVELFSVKYRNFLDFLVQKAPLRERCFLCKRLMLKLAERLAHKEKCKALVTGDILEEQASQTLPALNFVAEEISPLRPLLGFTKEEVYEELTRFGLRDLAEMKLPPCPFAPKRPHTIPQISPKALQKIMKQAMKLPFQVKRISILYQDRIFS
ncbi:tRNA sulfurtransferase [Thermodesulfatator atlanticus]|uniref:hypothetical protein n=1 Tax=Thermodesulfatator atlanticus TaxID=501497 RepID=UPI0003B6EE10|nr:hypothetical protein [Thermodesulfatator atlanticus]